MDDDEDVELDPEQRRYLDDVHARLDTLDHYELLGVARDADTNAIRRAYFQRVRVVHPDRFFGKRLGRYKARMEAIFARMTHAYETLLAPDKRSAYDAARAAPVAAPAPVDPATAARRKAALAALEQQLAAGRARAAAQAEVHVRQAARARAAGDVVGAAAAYAEALRLTPDDPDLREAVEANAREVGERRVAADRRQAELEERHGHWAQAAASWQRVLDAHPDDADARARFVAARARAT